MSLFQHRGLRADITHDAEAAATISFAGEFDRESADLARRAIDQLAPGIKQVILDLGQVSFFDVAGLRFLLAAREKVITAGGELILRNSSAVVRRVLELTGALPLFFPGSLAQSALSDPEVASVCEVVVSSAIRAGSADMGNVQVVEPGGGALRIVAQRGFDRPFLDFFEIVDGKESACGTALTAGQPVWIADVAGSPVFAGTPALDVMLEADCLAVASVPVLAADRSVIAMISTHRRQPTDWTSEQKLQLEALAAATGRLLSL